MFIQQLVAYARERMAALPPPMYQEHQIRYFLALRNDGSLAGVRDTASPADPDSKNGVRRMAPHIKRSSGVRPKLLADNAAYALGIGDADSHADRVAQQHAAFVDLVERCAAATREPLVETVAVFLRTMDQSTLRLPADFDPSATLTFEVGPALELPIDLPSVQRYWAMVNGAGDPDDTTAVFQCIGCGQRRPALERHPIKIKGVPGGQILKDLVSANADAFLSYGLKASTIAPMCHACAEGYANALNALLADPSAHIWMKEGAYAFWTREPSAFSPALLLSQPIERQSEVAALLRAHQTGREAATDLDPTAFYSVGLGASGARLVVTDWIETTVGEAQRRLGRYFALQEMVEWDGSPGQAVPLYRLTGATVRDPRKEEPPPAVARSLIRLALTGTPLPMDVLYLAVRRNRASQDVTRERAMLIKMVLCSQADEPEGGATTMSELDDANTTPAYLCGRLLATLDQIQALAIPGANAGIVDKFYGTASSAPASVFGTLMHGAQAHLGKLRRDRPGAHHRLQETLEEIMAPLPAFPKTLTLEEQGLFALGFYHQRAANRKAAREAAQARTGSADLEAAEA